VLVTILIVYGMIYVDVTSRAKEAYREAEKFTSWHKDPVLKKSFLEQKYIKDKRELDSKLSKRKLSKERYEQDLEILGFDKDHAMKESSIKYAYQWYKDTYELFSPPESIYVRKARLLAHSAKQMWREELQSKNIPFEEYMLDLENGESEGKITVFSTACMSTAEKMKGILRAEKIESEIFDSEAEGYLKQEGIKLIVGKKDFWKAHRLIKGNMKEFK